MILVRRPTVFIKNLLALAKDFRRGVFITGFAGLLTLQPVLQAASSLPSGGAFVAGAGNIAASRNALTINQSSLRAILDWNTFTIGQGNSVNFLNGSGVTLNRVTGNSTAAILGRLTASGSVYLIAPNGLLIGPGATVKTGGDFLASTLNLSKSLFLAAKDLTFTGPSTAAVVNLGDLASTGGSIYLIGRTVQNSGSINTPNGTTALAAGSQVLLTDSANDQRVFVQAPGGDLTNSGYIRAAQAELKSNGGNIYALAGNNGGQIQATGTANREGRIWLIADNGTANISGRLSASNVNGAGGSIETSGAHVAAKGATISTGTGGSWLLDPDDLTIDSSLAGTIQTSLNAGTDVTEQTSAPVSGGNGDITVASNIAWTSAANLTLSAYRNIGVNTGVTISNTGSGNLLMRADNSSTGAGAIAFTGTGKVNYSGSTGTVSLLYDPTGSTKYQNPVNYSSNLTTNGAVSNQATAYMLVNNATDLQNISTNLNGNYALGKNVDAASISNFAPLGDDGTPYGGIFDGQSNTISHLNINASSGYYVGLFGYSTGTLRNVRLTSESILTSNTVNNVGGLVGANYGTITNTSTQGTLGNNVDGSFVGGLAGYNDSSATIAKSTSSMSVTATTNGDVGGLVGFNLNSISDSYATGAVAAGSGTATGGLAGYNFGTISRSFSTGLVTGGSFQGGLAGYNDGSFSNSYWNTTTSGQGGSTSVGSTSGATGQTTSQLQSGSLPTGFSSNTWSASAGSYPSLLWQAPTTITFSGTVYNGTTPLSSVTVIGLVNGSSVGTGTTNGSGVYTFQLLASTPTSGGILAYLSGGSYLGNTFTYGNAGGSFTGTDIYVNSLRLINLTNTSYSSMVTALNTALGATSPSNFLFTISGGTLSLNSGKNLYLANSASSFSLDQPITTTGTVTLSNTGSLTQTAALSTSGLQLIGTGGSYVLTNSSNAVSTVAANTGSINLKTAGPTTVGTLSSAAGITTTGSTTLTTTGDLTLANSIVAVGSGTPLTLTTGGAFTNNVGSNALVASGGRWLVYSQNPANDTRGGMTYNFKQYNYSSGSPAQLSGNGFIYTLAPSITVGLTGTVTKTYDKSSTAALASNNYTATGAIDGDSVSLTGAPTSGSYADQNAGTSKTVTVTGLSSSNISASNGAATVYGYQLASTSASGNVGTINAKTLTATTSASDKTYDKSTTASGSMTLNGIISGDSVTASGDTYAFSTPNAGNNLTVTESGASLSNSNYQLGTVATTTANINPKTLTATISASDKTYDKSTTATGSMTLNGIISGDSVTASGDSYAFSTRNAGNNLTVTESGAELSNGNYQLGTVGTTTANINPKTLTATISASGKTYDKSTTATGSMTLNGIISGDSVTASGDSYAFSTPNAGTNLTVTESGAELSNGNYQLGTVATTTANINPKTLTATISASDKTYDKSTTATGSMTLNGIISGDSVTTSGDSYAFSSPNAGTNLTVTESGASLSNGNYQLGTVATTTANINAKTLTATICASDKTYDKTTTATGAMTLDGVINGDTVTASGDRYAFSSPNAGTNLTVTESGASLSNSNYQLGTVATTTANINPKTLTATISAADKTYDKTTATTGSITLNGILSEDSVDVSGDTYAFSTPNAGTNLTVTESGASLSNGNYQLGSVATTTANINRKTLTATISAADKTYNKNTGATGSMSLNGIISGDSVSVSSDSYTFSTQNAGRNITVTEVGAALSNSNYQLGTVSTTTANINPKTLTATISAADKTYDKTTATTGAITLSGILSGDNVTTSGDTYAFSTPHAGTNLTVTESGASLSNSNYQLGTVATTKANINPKTLTATISAADKTYDKTTATTGAITLNGILSGDNVTTSGDSYAFSTPNVGTNLTVTESGAALSNSNYQLGAVSTTTANINPAALTYTANAATRIIGTQNPALTGSVTGFVADDSLLSATTGSAVFSTTAGAHSAVGTYAINGSGLSAINGNYTFKQAASNASALAITPAALTIVIGNASRLQNQMNPVFTGTYNGPAFAGLDIPTLLAGLTFQTAASASSPAGTYPITASANVPPGIAVNIVPGTLTVIDNSPQTIPSQVIDAHTAAPLSANGPAPSLVNFVQPSNSSGTFQIAVPAVTQPFAINAAGLALPQLPLAHSSFFDLSLDVSTNYSSGVKIQ